MNDAQLKVLIIEDESEIREFLLQQFLDCGVQAWALDGGEKVIEALEQYSPDVILLDQMMPGKSGHQVIQDLRSNAKYCEIPIMMVTGLDGELDKVKALELGADDYVTKPFSTRELVVRAQALFRRSKLSHKSQQKNIVAGDLTVDFSSHKVFLRQQEVGLTLTEFKILCELLRQSGQVLTRDRLREKALGNLNVTDRTIDVHMASLRKKLEGMSENIETVRGVGYRLAPRNS